MHISIRWRLALNFAAIALLCAAALGAVLLTTVRTYYADMERTYLTDNARSIADLIPPLLAQPPLTPILQSRLNSLAFLSQSRVKIIATDGRLLGDSNSPQQIQIYTVAYPADPIMASPFNATVSIGRQSTTTTTTGIFSQGDAGFTSVETVRAPSDILIFSTESQPALPLPVAVDAGITDVTLTQIPVAGTFYGFAFNETGDLNGKRSDQTVQEPIYNSHGMLLGHVELSEGPAYGTQILENVARAWLLAGAVAVILAAAAGWWISRSISAPLVALTSVTTQMAAGDLSIRAPESRRPDEVGTLSRSFNGMADQVEGTIASLRRFISDAAHEIHTPLTALRTNLELAPESVVTQRAREQVARLEKLTAGLLDLSRLDAATHNEAPVNLTALVQELSESCAARAEQAGIDFELTTPEEAVVVQGDAAQLQQALGNLLDNALKFTSEGGRVTLQLTTGDGQAILEVEDTGIGIPEEDLNQIFSRFHRGRNAADYAGCGLGLAIVRAIAEGHHGTVKGENSAHGARFTLTLPWNP